MTKEYGKWNDATYYPNCNKVSGELTEYSTEKMLYADTAEFQIRYYYSIEEMEIGSFEAHILLRVAASHGITKGQLEKYLIMQGMEFDKFTIDERLYEMVNKGYLSLIKYRNADNNSGNIIYDIGNRGVAYLKKNELPAQNPMEEYLTGKDLLRHIRIKILTNQIALHSLCEIKNIKHFYFQREFKIKDKNEEISIHVPLYIQTETTNYAFEFVGNNAVGKKIFEERIERYLNYRQILPENTVLVIVAETYDHMMMLISKMDAYEKRDLNRTVLYTHDAEWFYDISGRLYAMARAMGQSGLMTVNII
ncbi:MAG: hypothetical protein IKS56_03785 [Lachnospiraceae bacterium]|nr:hypothetical protein [Lachnospiraceae bacterium]